MNVDFVKNNIVPLAFFTWFNIYTTHLYYSNTLEQNGVNIFKSMAAYEFINIFIELNNHRKRPEPQIALYLGHHIVSVFATCYYIYIYEPTIIFHASVKCTIYIGFTNLFLNLQYVFPKSIFLKSLFASSFVYYRIIATAPYIINIFQGVYIIDNRPIFNAFVHTVPCLFFALNLYWGYLIIKKTVNKLNTLFIHKP
jgi:hypothetical protein